MIKRLAVLFCIFIALGLRAGEDPTPAPVTDLQRLAAAVGSEPLAAIGIDDVHALPGKFTTTNFGKMLNDPEYKDGLTALLKALNNGAELDLGELLSRASKLMSGPAVAALVPDGTSTTGETGLKIMLYALTASEDTARELNSIWPKDVPGGIFSMLKLQTVLAKDLPDAAKLPEWATTKWPGGDIAIRVQPKKLMAAMQKGIAAGNLESFKSLVDNDGNFLLLPGIDPTQIDTLGLNVKLDNDMFLEQLSLELAPDAAGSFAKVVSALRDKPKNWDSLTAALPGDQDLTILLQADPRMLGDGLPLATQSLERFLRGRRWAKKSGKAPESIDSKRYDFIFDRLNGEMGIVAMGSLTGQFNVSLATAMKSSELDALRTDLTQGLDTLGATFEALKNANVRTIGGSPPLGATFQGRGLFTSPLIGLSKGWAWLCSSLDSYKALVASFSNGRTLATTEAARAKAAAKVEDAWHKTDSARLQINLQRVLPPLYVAWTLSGSAAPAIGNWRIPAAMLVIKFQTFTERLGLLRAGLSRTDHTVTSISRSTFPGSSLILPFMLQQVAGSIDESRVYAATPAPPAPATSVKATDPKPDDKKEASSAESNAPKGQP